MSSGSAHHAPVDPPARMLVGEDEGIIRRRLETSLQEREQWFARAFAQSAVGMALVNVTGRFLQVNRALCEMLGFGEPELLAIDLLTVTFHGDKLATRGELYRLVIGEVARYELEKRYQTRRGDTLWILETVSAVRDPRGVATHFVLQVQNITARKLLEQKLDRLTHYDILTGLANRATLVLGIEHAVTKARRRRTRAAVGFVDLDRFKDINDIHGREAGDEVLRVTATRLRRALRETDLVARLGGGEFVILLTDVRDDRDVAAAITKLRGALFEPVRIGGRALVVSASIGVSIAPDDGADARTLLKNADVAKYHAKSSGRAAVSFYNATMTAAVAQRRERENQLRAAIAAREFQLHYQPQVTLASGRIDAAEALLRWCPVPGQVVRPADFIPLAEETGLIVPLGEWVLRTACRHLQDWQEQGLDDLTVAVNVSARELNEPEYAARAREILRSTGVDSTRVRMEITESLFVGDSEQSIATLQKIKALGVHICIDDFGTGYSSLSYLKRLEPRLLKIDQSFVRDVMTDSRDAAIVKATITMAQALGLRSVAEGVETEGQLAFLRRHRCDEVQGYYYSQPIASEKFGRFLERRSARQASAGNASAAAVSH